MLNSRVALFISRVANFNSRVAISKKEDHPGRPTRQTRPTLSPAYTLTRLGNEDPHNCGNTWIRLGRLEGEPWR